MRRWFIGLSLALALTIAWSVGKTAVAQEPGIAQYFADATASIWRGNLLIWREGSTARAVGDAYPLPVDISGGSGTVEVEGQTLTDIVSVLNQIDADTDTLSALAPDCDTTVPITVSATGNNEVITLGSGEITKICDGVLVARGAVEVQLVYGTGTNCGTGEQPVTGPVSLAIDGTQPPGIPVRGAFVNTVSQAVCVELSGNVQVDGYLSYVQYTP